MTIMHLLLDHDLAFILSDTLVGTTPPSHIDKTIAFPRLRAVIGGCGFLINTMVMARVLSERPDPSSLVELAAVAAEGLRSVRASGAELSHHALLVGAEESGVAAYLISADYDYVPDRLTAGDYHWPKPQELDIQTASSGKIAAAGDYGAVPEGYAKPSSWEARIEVSIELARAQTRVFPATCGGSLIGTEVRANGRILQTRLCDL